MEKNGLPPEQMLYLSPSMLVKYVVDKARNSPRRRETAVEGHRRALAVRGRVVAGAREGLTSGLL
jgi:hypothetical protein